MAYLVPTNCRVARIGTTHHDFGDPLSIMSDVCR